MTQHPRNLQDPNLGSVLVRKNSLIRIKILFLGQNRPQVNQLKFIKILYRLKWCFLDDFWETCQRFYVKEKYEHKKSTFQRFRHPG